MKKITLVFICAVTVLVACTRKANPPVTQQPVPADTVRTNVKTEEQVKTEVPPSVIPSEVESGKLVYTTKCSRCHNAKPVANWNMKEWESILKSMVPRSKLVGEEEKQLRAYILAYAKAE